MYDTNSYGVKIPTLIYLNFNCPSVGVETRRKIYEFQQQNGIETTWTPIKLETKILNKDGYNQALKTTRRQFPVIPSNAITINKSQGSSYNNIALHLTTGLRRDLLYVGCSRSYTLDGLFLHGEFEPPGAPPKYLTKQIKRLK